MFFLVFELLVGSSNFLIRFVRLVRLASILYGDRVV